MTGPRADRVATLALGAASLAALLWLALWNGYPLLHFDTGAYVKAAFDRLAAPVDRPLVYGWFIWATSANASVWPVVVAQALLALWVMRLALRLLAPTLGAARVAACVIATAALSSAPIFVGQLTPDVFSGLLPLALFALIAGFRALRPVERAGLCALVAVGVGSHASHVAITLATIAALVALRAGLHARDARVKAPGGGTFAALAGTVIACAVVAATNYAQFGRFTLSPGAHVFLLGRLLEDGPALRHLQRACPQAGYRLCADLERLPTSAIDYLWKDETLARTGGWLGSREESWTIIGRTLAGEPGAVAADALRATARQLVTATAMDMLAPLPRDQGALRTLAYRHPADVAAIEASRQQQGALRTPAFRAYDDLVRLAFVLLALSACALAWRVRRRDPLPLQLVVACAAFFVVNAFVCGALSGLDPRYQSRVSWPLAFAGIALVAVQAPGAAHTRRRARAARP